MGQKNGKLIYRYMIKESKSTPSIIREVFNGISRGITINLKEGSDFIIQKDINKTLYVNNVQRSLLCNLDRNILKRI